RVEIDRRVVLARADLTHGRRGHLSMANDLRANGPPGPIELPMIDGMYPAHIGIPIEHRNGPGAGDDPDLRAGQPAVHRGERRGRDDRVTQLPTDREQESLGCAIEWPRDGTGDESAKN